MKINEILNLCDEPIKQYAFNALCVEKKKRKSLFVKKGQANTKGAIPD